MSEFNTNRAGTTAGARDNVKETLKAKATEMGDRAREKADARLVEAETQISNQIREFGTAIRLAADHLDRNNQGQTARLITSAADRIENFSGRIEGRDLGSVLGEISTIARRHPAAFVAGTMALGFLASRILKAGSDNQGDMDEAYFGQSGYAPGTGEVDPFIAYAEE